MQHTEKTIERFKYIPEGSNIAYHINELPDDLKISCFNLKGNTMRLNENDASPTLVPGHSNFPIHPKEHRSITVREAACITGFPKNMYFGVVIQKDVRKLEMRYHLHFQPQLLVK